jgi:hypothetical protein
MGENTIKRQTRKLISKITSIRSITRKICPPGEILRKGYMRRYSTAVKARGITVKRKNGSMYRVKPTGKEMHVEARCIKNTGLPGKGPVTRNRGIGPLKKGELAKHGYSFRETKEKRRLALNKAILEYTATSVYHKLDAVAKLTLRTIPAASKVYAADRDWVKTFM